MPELMRSKYLSDVNPIENRLSRYVGKTCLVVSSTGTTRVGRFEGLISMGAKSSLEFVAPSGTGFLVQESYMTFMEVINEEAVRADD